MKSFIFQCLLEQNLFLLHLFFHLSSLPVLIAQFHFNDQLTTERTVVPSSCKAPNGKPSLCVPPSRCKQLSALLKNLQKPISGDVGKYIKDSFVCKNGFKGAKSNEVCCPLDGIQTRANIFKSKGKYFLEVTKEFLHL